MIPRTRTVPLFEGTVNIAGESYALVGVDVAARTSHFRFRSQKA